MENGAVVLNMGSCLNFATRASIVFHVSHFDHVGSNATNPKFAIC